MQFEDDIRDQPSFFEKLTHSLGMKYQYYLDRATPHHFPRWIVAFLLLFIFVYRILTVQGFYIVCYALFIHYLAMFLAFLTPQIDPALDLDDEDDGPALPNKNSDEFRPFMRRLPEFKFWISFMRATMIAIGCTFFEFFDIPVFWPILVAYFIMLTVLTMKRQIMHMIKYKYIPFNFGKPRHTAEGGNILQ
ncbi:Protein RER1 [Strongyloides ratti]|uniref:Protein RER1 n=1 Tax=Strongyloides ratti TaxID=34506 RepID=A0A090L409_STRRB|nr:Protein RER1 [Strongyloides ratti]CEF64551.1 Protein RER1 [Strongyloides ratti]